jgi:hypothetical protein
LQELFDLWCLYSALQLVPREKQRHAYLAAVKQRYKHLPEISRIDRYVGGPFEFSFLLCFVNWFLPSEGTYGATDLDCINLSWFMFWRLL